MLGVMTVIQYLHFKLCYCWDAHPVVEPYCVVLVDHKSQCFPHQHFIPNSLQLWIRGLCYANLLYKSRLRLYCMKGRLGSGGGYVEFQFLEFLV